MKYIPTGAKKSDVIRKYVIENNSLIVIYLDGHNETFEYSTEKEDEIIEEMLKQAYDFVNDKELDTTITKEEYKKVKIQFLFTLSYLATTTDNPAIRAGAVAVMTVLFVAFLIMTMIVSRLQIIKSNASKYKKYLDMRSRLKKYKQDSCLREGVDDSKPELTINTVDEYSNREIRILDKNIEKCKEKELISYNILGYICNNLDNQDIFDGVLGPGEIATAENIDDIIDGMPLDKMKALHNNVNKLRGI